MKSVFPIPSIVRLPIEKILLSVLALWAVALASATAQTNEWAVGFGGLQFDQGLSIAVDGLGNVYTTGSFQGSADLNPDSTITVFESNGSHDIYISKLNTSGYYSWTKTIGGPTADYGRSIAVDGLGNVYVTGFFEGEVDFDPGENTHILTGEGSKDIFILKLDTEGDFVWAKNIGGPLDDRGYDLTLDASGNLYDSGFLEGTVDFDPGPETFEISARGTRDCYIVKLDANGDFIWALDMGGTNVTEGYAIAIDGSGNILTTGIFGSTADFAPGPGEYNLHSEGMNDIFVSKLTPSGAFIWAVRFGGPGTDRALAIAVDESGNVYTAGSFEETADFYPGDATYTFTAAGGSDAYISKLDASGNFVWAKSMGGNGFDACSDIALDGEGHLYAIGYFQFVVDFDTGIGIYNIESINQYRDVFVSKLDVSGDFIYAMSMGGVGTDNGYGIAVDGFQNVYTTGSFEKTAYFDLESEDFILESHGSGDAFVHKMHGPLTGTSYRKQKGGRILLYPNPTAKDVTLEFGHSYADIRIRVVDLLGRVLETDRFHDVDQIHLTLPEKPGMYFIKIHADRDTEAVVRVLKQ